MVELPDLDEEINPDIEENVTLDSGFEPIDAGESPRLTGLIRVDNTVCLPDVPKDSLICQVDTMDCVPTAMANLGIFNGKNNREKSAILWRKIKKEYKLKNNINWNRNGVKWIEVPSLLEKYYSRYDGSTDDAVVLDKALKEGMQVLALANDQGDVKHFASHAVNVVGTIEKNGVISAFVVFDPDKLQGRCDYYIMPIKKLGVAYFIK